MALGAKRLDVGVSLTGPILPCNPTMSTAVGHSHDNFISAPIRKKKRKGAARAAQPITFSGRLQNVTTSIAGTEWIKACQVELETSLEKLGWDPPDVLVLGLGSALESTNAAAQLALVISICDSLKIARDRVSFFDPHFATEDIDGLREQKFSVLSENKRGKHVLQRRTLLVMPHCGIELYENILRENWSAENLRHLLLLGNILGDYATATPAAKLAREAPCLSRLWDHLVCDPIPPCAVFPFAFNNLGIQYVCMDSLPQIGNEIWTLPLADEMPSTEVS